MTKEVAEKIARGITDKIECNTVDIDDWAEFWGFTREEYEEFLDMAIKALEQQSSYNSVKSELEPCDDCISREEALKAMCDKCPMYNCVTGCSSYRHIEKLPSVTPKARWIPVTEKLPEEYIHVLCQFTLNGMGECYLAHGVFHVVGGLVMTCNEVIAWMPLPQPYAESEDKE